MALGGPDYWSFEGGFGSGGFWSGIVGGWADVITGAPNPFRRSGEVVQAPGGVSVPVVISEIPQTWEEYEEQYPEYFEPILETRPGRTPDPYPQDVVEEYQTEEEDVAHDWGHLFRQGATELLGIGGGTTVVGPTSFSPTLGTPAGVPLTPLGDGGCEGMAWTGAAPPKGYKVVNYCGRGVLRKIRRRRRRRMLTASDASDLATIVGIVGKGQMASSMINRTRS